MLIQQKNNWVEFYLLILSRDKPEIENICIYYDFAIENYDFVTKTSSFHDLNFEIGPLMSAILKSGSARSGCAGI